MSMTTSDLPGRYICFTLGSESFATPLMQVKEVIGNIDITPVPQAPVYYRGIINLRGQVIPIIDLRLKLNTKKNNECHEMTVIILDFNPHSIGIIVDSIENVSTFNSEDISASMEVSSLIKSELILGVAKKEEGMTLILDLKAVLEIRQYHELASSAA